MTIPLFIIIFPLLAAVLIGFFGERMKSHVARVGVVATASAFFISVSTLYQVSTQGPVHIMLWPLDSGGASVFKLGLLIDRLTAVMMVLITSVSTVIHVYSIRYLEGDSGYIRFFALLSFITFVILSLVSSSNLFMLFVFWSLLSWALYLILVFNYSHPDARKNAFKTFIVHRVGDVCFLFGIFLAYRYFGTLEFSELFRAARQTQTISLLPGNILDVNAVSVISLLIFVGAMAKSAQFPLHVWLPDTMDSPTPVSALMHAGIVNAGGFLLNRLAPFYALSPTTLHVVFLIGVLTVLLGASMMLVQNDIKKTLGFSTMGQMGYMIMECGLGAFALAIFHLIAHGLFKATLFLRAGQGIHDARDEPEFPHESEHEPVRAPNQLSWYTGLILTLIMPLIILMVAHDVLDVPLKDANGAVIFLFFAWVTASQAMFSLYRLHPVGSWAVVSAMIGSLFFIVFVYLWAGEAFTHFIYHEPGVAAGFFKAAAFNPKVFDMLVLLATLLIIFGWVVIYTNSRGQSVFMKSWVVSIRNHMYILLVNRFYLDLFYVRCGSNLLRWAQKVAHRF
ncbi:putative NADH-quinone oxidoreductase, subunit L [Nitrospina gracilis 3/211]|uniref:Putative NADH-quinone oxidoreductase, subunit L n=2 Tax=Nitrospina TaxID=35800 RepID=M1YUB7_NITG3|nr:proton-conducting transporter membrane subunit [Nitrospina sp. Nb-3]MCF8722315.1 NADH-quinone oxidoreductase subunit L [Nitrospina sp. Nb-3]CCQ89150.1 putative NADH-quinone oxidoreductase, subunit L [Nitrospina gracilis 3/211]